MNPSKSVLLLIILSALALTRISQAQNSDLEPFSTLIGNPDTDEVQTWTFSAVAGEVISLLVEGEGSYDPVLELVSETGSVLLVNDDYDPLNTTDAALQAITLPFTGTFTVRVQEFNNQAGAYTLTRLRGFANGFKLNGFTPDETWKPTNDDLQINPSDGGLTLSLSGNNVNGVAVDTSLDRLTDYYAHTSVVVNEGQPGWVVHMTARHQSMDSYYLLSINNRGFWRFALQTADDLAVLRDWTSHPAITAGETSFDLGIMANQTGIDLFYNGSPLGHFVDDTLEGGVIGFGVGTAPGIASGVEVTFQDFSITIPLRTQAEANLQLDRLMVQEPLAVARSLERRQEIPSGGELQLNVPQSSVESSIAGISRIGLGRGAEFENFVMATDVRVENFGGGTAGCGIYLRASDEENYILAFLDTTGAYGISERVGEAFSPGVYGENPNLLLDTNTHQLLVIAVDEQLQLYIDGQLVGEINTGVSAGSIGNAAVNFEPNATTCLFENTWLWQW